MFINYSNDCKAKMAIWDGIHCRNRGCCQAYPPRSEISVAGFAAGGAAREVSLGVGASTRRWLPAWARNNLSDCNKYLFEHVHTSISGNSWLHWILDGVRLVVISGQFSAVSLLEAWNGGLNNMAKISKSCKPKLPALS